MSDARLLKLECLTPVHIGCGDALVRDIDFVSAGGVTYLLDSEQLLPNLGDLPHGSPQKMRAEIGRKIKELLTRKGSAAASYVKRTVPTMIQASAIRPAIRSADGRPLIPGSSIKGSLRTLLLAGLLCDQGPGSQRKASVSSTVTDCLARTKPRDRWAAQALEAKAFRSGTSLRKPTPHTDLLRMLAVSDATLGTEDTDIVSSKALNTTRETLTAVEVFRPGTQALLSMALRRQPLTGPGVHAFFSIELPMFEQIAQWSRTHARHLLKGDAAFFKNVPGGAALHERCSELMRQLGSDASIVLRLGWGTGWRTMTGDFLTEEERARLPMHVGKTRKVVLDGHAHNAQPKDLFGWVRISPISADEAAQLAARTARPAAPVGPLAPQPPQTPEAAVSFPPIDSFNQRVVALQPKDLGKVRGLYEEAQRTGDPDLRDRRLGSLAARLLALFGKDKHRLRSLGENMPALRPHFEASDQRR
jgi:CRISPR-associated protein Csm5